MYNDTFINSSNNILDLYRGINEASGNDLLTSIVLVLIWVIMFISMKHFDTKVCFLASSAITTLIAFVFFALELLSWGIVAIPTIMTMFSLIAFMWSGD